MYEVRINDKEVLKSFWPVEWLYSRILKAVTKAGYVDYIKHHLKHHGPDYKFYREIIFYTKSIPKISRIWGGQKLIKIQKIYE